MEPIIEVQNVSKKFTIPHGQGYITLRDSLMYTIKRPFSFFRKKILTVIGKETREPFWALKNINFNVEKGEVIGIIGANGAGKSTLLKILSKITPPTEGSIILRGKVASLLEVGTGFHPELTGRENIFLNGAILGMTRREIIRKFKDIVTFAGVEKFIDTPVKFYSSGMYVRLAFSVAAHMEPDILIVDEVLAVGDAEFQKKCLGKMEEVTRAEGRTILFVSHNMNAVQSLCKRCVFLEKGQIKEIGPTDEIIEKYLKNDSNTKGSYEYPENTSRKMTLRKLAILDEHGTETPHIELGRPFSIDVEYDVQEDLSVSYVGIIISDQNNNPIILSSDVEDHPTLLEKRVKGRYKNTFTITPEKTMFLNHGTYFFKINLETTGYAYSQVQDIKFTIVTRKDDPDFVRNKTRPILHVEKTWKVEKIDSIQ